MQLFVLNDLLSLWYQNLLILNYDEKTYCQRRRDHAHILERRCNVGNTYQYFALISEKQYKRSALHEVVSQYYDNSYTNVVSAFIEEEGLSVEDLKALIRQIEQGRKK